MSDIRSQLVEAISSVPDVMDIQAIVVPEDEYTHLCRRIAARADSHPYPNGVLTFCGIPMEPGNVTKAEVRYRTVGLLV